MHKGNYNIDYNSVQFFEYEKSRPYQNPLYKTSHCVKYVIAFTETTNDNRKYFSQYFIDDLFRVTDSWSTFDEKEKHLNWWASVRPNDYGKTCE